MLHSPAAHKPGEVAQEAKEAADSGRREAVEGMRETGRQVGGRAGSARELRALLPMR